MDPTSLDYYASHGPITDPGVYAPLLAGLPREIGDLCRVVQGLLLHMFWTERYGVQLTAARRDEVHLRYVARQVERILALDPRALNITRPPHIRLVGVCRDFAVLLATLLRQQGVPARARCGFGAYLELGLYKDHWVGEYWNAAQGRWVLVDAQLDEFQVRTYGIKFDPLDVPRDQFIVGGAAWQLYRSGQADPNAFGILDMHGPSSIRGGLVHDVAALNKVELLPWDTWGLAQTSDDTLTTDDLAALDEMAALTAGDVPEDERVRALYQGDARWRVPPTITSWVEGVPQSVVLSGV